MARTVRDAKLETRSARAKLPADGIPRYRGLDQGLHLGYRKGKTGGKWVVRWYSGSAYKVGHGYILGLPVAAYLTVLAPAFIAPVAACWCSLDRRHVEYQARVMRWIWLRRANIHRIPLETRSTTTPPRRLRGAKQQSIPSAG